MIGAGLRYNELLTFLQRIVKSFQSQNEWNKKKPLTTTQMSL